jgi:hypothetical protein
MANNSFCCEARDDETASLVAQCGTGRPNPGLVRG